MLRTKRAVAVFCAVLAVVLSGEAAAQGVLYTFDGDLPPSIAAGMASGAGDVNNDGYNDLIVGVPDGGPNGTNSGSARVYSGQNGSILYTFYGDSAHDHLGVSVSGAGDVNNDGYDDLIAGAHFDDNNGDASGSARVYSGQDGSILYTFFGDSVGDVLGISTSGAGDVNNDGYDDLIAGAPYDNNTDPDAGSARVYSGQNGSILYTFYGVASRNLFGSSVSGAGDVNNDGNDDLIVGSPLFGHNSSRIGSASVFSGRNGSTLFSSYGSSNGDMVGVSVSGAGDVNNDGYNDVIIGARGMGVAGAALVHSGQNGSILYTFSGGAAGATFGRSVSGAGDVNNDGYDDLIVGIPSSNPTPGYAEVYSGQDGSILYTLGGYSDRDYFGVSVSGAGDVNNDGYDDFIVWAPWDSNSGSAFSRAWVYSGTCGEIVHYGSGCPGTGGRLPALEVDFCPTPGGTVMVAITGGLTGAWTFLFLGTQQAAIPMSGSCTLNVHPPLLPPFPLPPLSGAGELAIPVTFPITAVLGTIMLQVFVQDVGVPHGYSNTNGVQLSVQ